MAIATRWKAVEEKTQQNLGGHGIRTRLHAKSKPETCKNEFLILQPSWDCFRGSQVPNTVLSNTKCFAAARFKKWHGAFSRPQPLPQDLKTIWHSHPLSLSRSKKVHQESGTTQKGFEILYEAFTSTSTSDKNLSTVYQTVQPAWKMGQVHRCDIHSDNTHSGMPKNVHNKHHRISRWLQGSSSSPIDFRCNLYNLFFDSAFLSKVIILCFAHAPPWDCWNGSEFHNGSNPD